MAKTVLIVDDDPHIRDVLRFALEQEGFSVLEAGDGRQALETFQAGQPQLVILDIVMPEMDGLELCRTLRKTSEVPILFLSSRDEEVDRILGLELGGDDYLTKPFSPRELMARVKVIFRWLNRQHAPPAPEAEKPLLAYGHVRLNTESCCAYWQERPVPLTVTEFNLLQTFLRHPQRMYSRDDLIAADLFKDIITDRTIDSHIRRLRKKFADAGAESVVETVRGMGYKLGSCQ